MYDYTNYFYLSPESYPRWAGHCAQIRKKKDLGKEEISKRFSKSLDLMATIQKSIVEAFW